MTPALAPRLLPLGFLASHGGSNLQAILDACRSGQLPASPRVVISNNSGCLALERARRAGVAALHLSAHTHPDPQDLDRAILRALQQHAVELVVLAGYMRKLGPATLEAYRGRILNIHPALLPRFGGQGMYGPRVHEAVLAGRETVTGVTIHLVDERYDAGPILAQREVPVLPGDTAASLGERVLAVEHQLYVDTLQQICDGRLRLPGSWAPGRAHDRGGDA